MSLLSLQGVSAFYGASQALHGVDLTIGEGEVRALMGRNGMGKTTLMKTLMGIVPERGGDVSVGDTPITGMKSHQRVAKGIAYVP